ncbi:MAG: hypothetical protein HRT47_13260 [Candidatus Caenarcaniphilales bacterium]|nr:hypothetical protein [Candidatus Caenarcaniphilales bacterium]NQY81270.1 hypothetical protein [Candidatus Caenarcaniphilales bacterium]
MKLNEIEILLLTISTFGVLTLNLFYMKYRITKRDGELDPNKSFLENFFSA